MKIGFLYAGQGSQCVGMGKDLYEEYPEFREVYDNIDLDDTTLVLAKYIGEKEAIMKILELEI